MYSATGGFGGAGASTGGGDRRPQSHPLVSDSGLGAYPEHLRLRVARPHGEAPRQLSQTAVTRLAPFNIGRYRQADTDHRRRRGQGGGYQSAEPPMTLEEYIPHGRERGQLLAYRFDAMPTTDQAVIPRGRSARVNRVVAWRKHWRHLGHEALELTATMPFDTNWIRTPDEFVYQQHLLQEIERLRTDSVKINDVWDAPCCLPRPSWDVYFLRNLESWTEDMLFEVRRRVKSDHNNPNGATYFTPWQHTECFSIPASARSALLFPRGKWWQSLEPSRFCACPSPWITSYCAGLHRDSDPVMRDNFEYMAMREFLEFAILTFIFTAPYGVTYSREADARVLNSGKFGLLTPLPDVLRSYLNDASFLAAFHGSDFNPALVLLAFYRSEEVDWAAVKVAQGSAFPYVWYEFESGLFINLPPA